MSSKMKKRSDGRYQQSVAVGFKADGTPKRKVVYGRTQREVTDKANELRRQIGMGLDIGNDMTVEDWSVSWLKIYKSGVAYNTYRMYETIVNLYIIPTIGVMKVKDIKTAHLQSVINENASKPRTVQQFRLTISQILQQAVANDLILKNPADGVVLPVVTPKYVKRALTDEEMEKVKSIDVDLRVKCFVTLLLYTGLRKGEALALTRADIDFAVGEISINKSIIFKGNKGEIKDNPKTKSGIRCVPILDPLKMLLEDYLSTIEGDLLFTTKDGQPMSAIAYRRMWAKFEKAVGTKEITAHIFRHNFATILYNAGVDVKMAQSILGQKTLALLWIYIHI